MPVQVSHCLSRLTSIPATHSSYTCLPLRGHPIPASDPSSLPRRSRYIDPRSVSSDQPRRASIIVTRSTPFVARTRPTPSQLCNLHTTVAISSRSPIFDLVLRHLLQAARAARDHLSGPPQRRLRLAYRDTARNLRSNLQSPRLRVVGSSPRLVKRIKGRRILNSPCLASVLTIASIA